MTDAIENRESLRERVNRWRTDPRVQSWLILMLGVATAVAIAFSGQAYYKATKVAAQREAQLAKAQAIQIAVEQSAAEIRAEVCDLYAFQSRPTPPPSTTRGLDQLREARRLYDEKHCRDVPPATYVPTPSRTELTP